MASLTPVDFDPFADAPPVDAGAAPAPSDGKQLRITVRPKSFKNPNADDAAPKLTPVDHDPFAEPSVTEDVAKSATTGAVKGVGGMIGLPDTISNVGAGLIDKATAGISNALGIPYERPQVENSPLRGVLPTAEGTTKAMQGEFPAVQDWTAHEPQTRAGRYAETIGEFAPGAIAPGGLVRNAIKYAVLPGAASEAAGEATKGSAFEPIARGAAALATGGITALASRPTSAARVVRNQMPEGVTPQMVTQAEGLMTDATRHGVTLSWPEALSHVAGRPVLSNAMRHLEAAPATEARMVEYFAPRAQQVEQAGADALHGVGPANGAPSTIGPAFGREAENAVNSVRDTINRATAPYYNAAEGVRLTAPEMRQVRAVPGWREARQAIRSDAQLNRYVSHLPDDSVGFLDQVKKYLDQQGKNAAALLAQNPNMQRAAGYGNDARDVRTIALNASGRAAGVGNPNPYEVALNAQEQTRRQFLEPILQGPLGRLADKDIPTQKAINVLFPNNPLPNSAGEVETAVRAVAVRSPRAATDLVRAHAESVFNESTQALQSGANQAGGAKFAATLVGNPQQRANLQAAVEALPNGAARWQGFERFLDVMEATGTRQNIGSKTAYNDEFLRQAGSSGIVGEAAKGLSNPVGRLGQGLADKYERWRLGQNLDQLADILTNPRAGNELRSIARMAPDSRRAYVTALRIANLSRPTLEAFDPTKKTGQ